MVAVPFGHEKRSKKYPIYLAIVHFGKKNIPIFTICYSFKKHSFYKKGLTSKFVYASHYLLFNVRAHPEAATNADSPYSATEIEMEAELVN